MSEFVIPLGVSAALRVEEVGGKAATPFVSWIVPRGVAPSLKVTVPVGDVPQTPPLELTVAVKVTDCPVSDGLIDEVNAVLVAKPEPAPPVSFTTKAAKIPGRVF